MQSIGKRGLVLFSVAALALLAGGTLLIWQFSKSSPIAGPDEAELFPDDSDSADGQEKDAHQEVVVNRIREKEAVVASLIRNEITFAQAVQRFGDLNADDPNALSVIRARYPRASTEELLHRQVIGYVRGARRLYPDEVAKLLPKLERELYRRFPPRGNLPPAGPKANAKLVVPPPDEIPQPPMRMLKQ